MKEKKSLQRSEKVIINLITSGIAWGWPILLSFVTAPLLVRGLGNDSFGIRGLIISITGYFALLDMGLNGAVTKYLAEYKLKNDNKEITELLGTTFTTFASFGLFGGILICILAKWFTIHLFSIPIQFQSEAIWAFRLSGIGFFLSMITWWASSIPAGLQRFDVLNGISIGFGTLTTISALVAIYLGYGLIGVIITNILSNLIAFLGYTIANIRLLPGIKFKASFDKEMFKKTILFGLYMVGFRVFGLLSGQLDTMFIGIWIGTAAITFYTVPHQIAQIVHGVNGKLMQIIFPMASEFFAAGDKNNLERMLLRGFNLTLVVGLAIAIPLAVVGEKLLLFWMSPEIAQKSYFVLEILVLGFFFYGFTALTTSYLGGINFPQLVMYGSLVNGLTSLMFYLVLIKGMGINGAAISKSVSMFLTLLYYLLMIRWKSHLPMKSLLKIFLRAFSYGLVIGCVMHFFVVPYVNNLYGIVLVVMLTALLFILTCWKFGVFDNIEKESVLRILYRFIPTL